MAIFIRSWLSQQLVNSIGTLRLAFRWALRIHGTCCKPKVVAPEITVNMRDESEHSGCCRQCGYTLRSEFQREKFSLAYDEPSDFCRSQWQSGKRSLIWLLYRWLVAAFFIAAVLGSMIQQWSTGHWWIYLTDWGFLLCMCTFTYGAIIATLYYFNQQYFAPDSLALKIYWASHWTTLVLATLITLVFWAFLFPLMPEMGGDLYNIWAHACNSIFMILDQMLVAFPSRLMHFVYPFIVGITYGLFSLFYYVGGGLDAMGHNYIYPILQWSKPGLAIGTVVGCIIFVSVFCFIHFWLYRLRVLLHKKFNQPKEPSVTA